LLLEEETISYHHKSAPPRTMHLHGEKRQGRCFTKISVSRHFLNVIFTAKRQQRENKFLKLFAVVTIFRETATMG
jgi:hypothetical protein